MPSRAEAGFPRRCGVALAGLALLAACSQARPVQISGLKQGLMRQAINGEWTVYDPRTAIPLAPNGECEIDGNARPCTWFGIEFKYAGAEDGARLDCTARLGAPSTLVGAEGVVATDAREHKYALELKSGDGSLAIPSYVVDDAGNQAPDVAVVCLHGKEPVLRYAFTFEAAQ